MAGRWHWFWFWFLGVWVEREVEVPAPRATAAAMTAAFATALARHVDPTGTTHRLLMIDGTHLKCLPCGWTVLVPSTVASTSTSPSPIPGPLRGQDTCERHPGESAGNCRCCASDRKGHDEPPPVRAHVPTADLTAARARVAAALRRPAPPPTEETADA